MEGNATRMSTNEELRFLARILCGPQTGALFSNRHKGHWGNQSLDWLCARAREELHELQVAIRAFNGADEDALGRTLEALEHECADVANFVAMILDVARARVHEHNEQRESEVDRAPRRPTDGQ